MDNQTTEFSFILKPSIHGVGVFSTQDIKKGTLLRLFGDEKFYENRIRMMDKQDVPKEFQGYCVSRGSQLVCPEDFRQMPVGWYLNHSGESNAEHK